MKPPTNFLASLRNRVFLASAVVAVLSIAFALQFVTNRVAAEAEGELERGLSDAASLLEQHLASFPYHNNGRQSELLARFKFFADVHTRHMLHDENEIQHLFDGFGTFSYVRTVTPGECVNPTYSYQIVASVL